MNNRRKLIVALGAGALATPFGSFAQHHGKVWRIGFLWEAAQSRNTQNFDAFKAGMQDLGHAEGKDYVVEQRSAKDDLAHLPALAAELLALKVDLFVTSGTPSAVAAHKATREIPILVTIGSDPVGDGLADSLRRPAWNVTGLTNLASELGSKRLDLLRQIVPGIRRVGYVYNPDNAGNARSIKRFEADCDRLGLMLVRAPLRTAEDLAAAFNILRRDRAEGLLVSASSTHYSIRASIVELVAKLGLPAIYGNAYFPDSGGMMSYASNNQELFRRAAAYADKIFKGAKPGDLPIEQPNKFEMVINLKTVKALGVKIPDVVMLRAERVIE